MAPYTEGSPFMTTTLRKPNSRCGCHLEEHRLKQSDGSMGGGGGVTGCFKKYLNI